MRYFLGRNETLTDLGSLLLLFVAAGLCLIVWPFIMGWLLTNAMISAVQP